MLRRGQNRGGTGPLEAKTGGERYRNPTGRGLGGEAPTAVSQGVGMTFAHALFCAAKAPAPKGAGGETGEAGGMIFFVG